MIPDEERGASVERYANPKYFPPDVQAFMHEAEQQCLEFGSTWFSLLADFGMTCDSSAVFYVLRIDGAVVAILPILSRASGGVNEVRSLGSCYTSLYAPITDPSLVVDERRLSLLLAQIKADHPGVQRWTFDAMDPQHASYEALRKAMRLVGLVTLPYFHFGNWYLPRQDWASFWLSRDSQLRSTVKRRGKKFADRGGTLEIITDVARVEAGIAAYQTVYASSWKNAEPSPRFVPGLIRIAAELGWLRLGLAWLDGKPIAAQIWLVGAGKASIFKLAYDESMKDLSAGTLLSAKLFEHVLRIDGVREIDYLIGDDAYKKSWMTHRRERWGIAAYNPWTIRGLAGLIRALLGRCAKSWLHRTA